MEEVTTFLSGLQIVSDEEDRVHRTLIGSYNWDELHEISVPGFPKALKRDFMTRQVGKIEGVPSTLEEVHRNDLYHDIYFEPIQEVLKSQGSSLSDFEIVTDRNTFRKMDAALAQGDQYPNFLMTLKKIGNSLLIKREETEALGSNIGIQFEDRICQPTKVHSTHTIIQAVTKIDGKSHKILIRSEIDAMVPTARMPVKSDYTLDHISSSGLTVRLLKSPEAFDLRIEDLREISMSRELKDSTIYQAWLTNTPSIIHGVKTRIVSSVPDRKAYHERFNKTVRALLAYADQMEEGHVYTITRSNGGPISFQKEEHRPTPWTVDP
eukprot:TRINITY_DN704_c0_g1_i1.p1 TRINITY_DN704_c0_g1~~TRINITY_DN704_c0_g1_i1.p1  ORF type:complete len:323 (-),score=57.46 TRINITY_DN704_c0_g1_i1:38-1006(-)